MNYSLEENYSDGYILTGTETDFKYKISIPKRKAKNEKFVLKQKSIIEEKYDVFKDLYKTIKNMKGRENDIRQPDYLLSQFSLYRRFNVEHGFNFLLLVKQDNEQNPYVSLNYEKHNRDSGLWRVTEIFKIYPKKSVDVEKVILKALENEWEIYDQQEVIKHSIIESFKKVDRTLLTETKMDTKTSYRAEQFSYGRRLFRLSSNKGTFVVLLRKEPSDKLHYVTIEKEYKSSFHHNVMGYSEFLKVEYIDFPSFEKSLLKKLTVFFNTEKDKNEEKSFIQKLLSI